MDRRLSEVEAKCLFNAIQYGWRASVSDNENDDPADEFCENTQKYLDGMESLQGFPYIEHLCKLVSYCTPSPDETEGFADVKEAAKLLALMVTTFDTRLISELKCIERLAITSCDYEVEDTAETVSSPA